MLKKAIAVCGLATAATAAALGTASSAFAQDYPPVGYYPTGFTPGLSYVPGIPTYAPPVVTTGIPTGFPTYAPPVVTTGIPTGFPTYSPYGIPTYAPPYTGIPSGYTTAPGSTTIIVTGGQPSVRPPFEVGSEARSAARSESESESMSQSMSRSSSESRLLASAQDAYNPGDSETDQGRPSTTQSQDDMSDESTMSGMGNEGSGEESGE
jgi:hypothetical protein